MKQTTETRTLQCWPGGQSFTFAGDLHAPANARKLRDTNFNGGPRPRWRKGTADEWRKIQIEVLAELYAERDVLACQSALVDDLIKAGSDSRGDLAEGFSYDEIKNTYADPSDWDIEKCHDYADDNGIDSPDSAPNPWTMTRAEIVDELTAVSIDCRDEETIETLRAALISNIDDETINGLDDWRDVCREHAQENPAEVFEWWLVSSWLCNKLSAIGEVVIDNGYGHWWGRTCTGQQFIMDGTLQQIAAQFIDRP